MDTEEEPYPNFDNAFPSQSTAAAAASWHPALRENTTSGPETNDDDFFERYPGPTPKKNAEGIDPTSVDEQSEPASPTRRQSISVLSEVHVTDHEASAEELEGLPTNHVEISARAASDVYEEEDDEALNRDEERPILSSEETAAEQEHALEDQMPDDEILGEEESGQAAPSAYEHQGDTTEMEEALEPSAGASLLQNEEPLPTTGLISRSATSASVSHLESASSFNGAPAPPTIDTTARPTAPSLERAFTTNFSDSPIPSAAPQSAQHHSQSIPDEWPSVGDDKTFGELLDHEQPAPTEHERLESAAAKEATRIAALDSELSPEDTKNQLLEATAAEEAQGMAAPDLDLLPEDEGEVKEEDLAAAWGAALDDDDMLEDAPAGLDPSHFFGDDDDGFLLDDPPAPTQPAIQQQQQKPLPAALSRSADLRPLTSPAQHTMPSPQFFDPGGHGRSAGTPSTGLFDLHTDPVTPRQAPQSQRPATLQQAQSFSDKSKGGYQSPYDLPMEVVKPRRRPQQPQPSMSYQNPPAPPVRTSSMGSASGPPASRGGLPSTPSASNFSPPPSRGSAGSGGVPIPSAASAKSTPKTSSGFFEELPMAPKQRARPSGAYTPQPTPGLPTPPPQAGPISPQRGFGSQQQQPLASRAAAAPPIAQPSDMYGGLRQPERMPLLPEQPSVQGLSQQQPPAPQVPPSNARYSPAPPATATSQPPAAASRYSPAPASQPSQAKARQPSGPNVPYGTHQANPFAPRTSSPLAAFTEKPHPPLPTESFPRSIPPSSPPKVNGLHRTPPDSGVASRYSPAKGREIAAPQQFGPPLQRPQTQSPDDSMKQPRLTRPVSTGVPAATQAALTSKRPALPHRRQFSREFIHTPPQDERAHDPLQRWKGYPIFKWSPSGAILSTFPKQTPFYAAGQGVPAVKSTPGPISVQDASHFMPMDEKNAKFPGPLAAKNKGKKKEVLAWMAGKIEDLERQAGVAMMDFQMPVDLKKRAEEKVVLWKMMRIFVEHDGVLDKDPKIEEEARTILLPNLAQMAQVAALQSPGSAVVERDAVDKHITLQLRQALLEGRREHAVWLAEEKRLWGHAMLIASTMGPDTWKQIVQAFVRNQVKSFGSDARGLAALYQVFAGNSEECVDELVPPSARAGFQMISMADGSVAGNPLEGLDQWRETLGLVTSNRTPNDVQSLISLGKMLAGYGRVEAAHTCYLFARALVKHSGPDDADAHFVLFGANHQAADESFGSDLDSIILTEIYEYATSLSAASTSPPYIPHLQAFKLVHAQQLAANGLKTRAQTYCDAITSAYTSTTRPSPYYHPTFTQAVAETSAFLSQTPHDGKGGLFTRPALNKVSSSATSWFTKFVSGDDDQDANTSAPGRGGAEGPFGGVNGDSGTVTRNTSGSDLYNPNMSNPALAQPFTPSSAPSRYAPGGAGATIKHVPAQPYSGMGMPAAEPQRPGSSRYAPASSAGSGLGLPGPELARKTSNYSLPNASGSRRGSGQDSMSHGSYEPRPALVDEGSPYSYSPQIHAPPEQAPAISSPLVLAQQPPATQEPEDAFGAPTAMPQQLNDNEPVLDEETQGGYQPPTGGYEPPSYSYQPYEPEPDSPEATKPKKAFGDEDDDAEMERRAASLKKAQADREADELFRKAAEADAARDNDKSAGAGQKKGWFGGWFAGGAGGAGGKDGNLAAPSGPIKAKLGEENSFYFDKDLGKWVNKKAGGAEAAAAAAPTPPPPKGPASRVVSAAMGPPSGPPSRNSSGTGLANLSRPPTSGSGPAFPSTAGSGPPSRTATPASLGAELSGGGVNGETPPPGVASAVPPLRPVSSLSNASSIDDLLAGPPGPRKAGGTVKGKKKGGRYVDVMAK